MYLMFTPAGVEFAYRRGIFPMHNAWTGEIDWYRPDPRTILPLDQFHISRSLAKTIRQGIFEVRVNTDFEGVMRGCAANREEGTWISEEFVTLYGELHARAKRTAWRPGAKAGLSGEPTVSRLAERLWLKVCFTWRRMPRKSPWRHWSPVCASAIPTVGCAVPDPASGPIRRSRDSASRLL